MMRNRILVTTLMCCAAFVTPACAQDAMQPIGQLSLDNLASFSANPQQVRGKLDAELMLDPTSVPLNFLSGLVYDAQSSAGSEGRQLARVGYLTALRVDPTYWPANYQLGLLALEDGDAVSAQRYFVSAAFYAPTVAPVFYALARAAYCAGDIASATLALEQAALLTAPQQEEELVTAALITAANGDREGAQGWLDRIAASSSRPVDPYLQNRIDQLLHPQPVAASVSKPAPPLALAPVAGPPASSRSPAAVRAAPPSASTPSPPVSPGTAAPPSVPQATPATASAPSSARRKMATVDVVIIRRKEARARTMGINLMDALSFQFGSTLINSERSRSVDRLASEVTADGVTTLNNINLTIPLVTYSLNIANSSGNQSAIEARPTLLVYDGQAAKVFSGGTLTYAASGQLSSQSYTKEVGLSLAVTPKFNDDDTVTLNIVTGLETFVETAAAGSFREAVQTDKSSTEITADLRFGDTVIVSGGRFNNLQTGKSVTPLLGSIPIVGNVFRQKINTYEANDLLVLLSLRRESGGSSSGSAEEIERVAQLGDRLWRRLGADVPDHTQRQEAERHRPYYQMDNPGRHFNKTYVEQVGLSDLFED